MGVELAFCSAAHVLFLLAAMFTVRKIHPNLSFFSPLAWYFLFHALTFVLVPIASRIVGADFASRRMGVYFTDLDYAFGYLVVDFALLSFIAGYTLQCLKAVPVTAGAGVPINWRRFRLAVAFSALLLGPLALYSAYETISGFTRVGYGASDAKVVMEMVNGVLINTNQVGYLVEFKNVLTPLVFLICVVLRFNKVALALIISYVAYRFFLGWERIHAVVLIAEVGLFYLYSHRRRWPPSYLIPAALLALPLFSYLGRNRDLFRALLSGDDFVSSGTVSMRDTLNGLDFANFDYLLFILRVVPKLSDGYTYGTQYLQLLTEPIPRLLWPGKPIGPPINLVNLLDFGEFTGLTRSVVGDAWMNLGWLGLVVTMAVTGYLAALSYRRFFSRGGYISAIGWISILPYSIQLFRDGGIVSIARFLIFALLPVVSTYFIYRQLGRRRT